MSDSDSDGEVEFEPEVFEVADRLTFEVMTVSFMPVHKLMYNAQKGVEISGQKVWCGSISVIQYLLKHPEFVVGCDVVELGAGTGILGMSCSRFGCGKLILTDNDLQSIRHMQLDCPRNHVDASVQVLDWFSPEMTEIKAYFNLGEVTTSRGLRVVAGDVLYKKSLLEPFFNTAKVLLELKEGSRMILCHVPRAGNEHSDVQAAAQRIGLQIEPVDVAIWRTEDCLKYCPEEDVMRAGVYLVHLYNC